MITTEFSDLFLTPVEMAKLEDLCTKYTWAQLLWNIAVPTNNYKRYEVGTLDAEEWAEVVQSEAAQHKYWLAGASGALRNKVFQFYNKVTSEQVFDRRVY